MSVMDAPMPQHLVALDRANKVRLARAALKAEIKADPAVLAGLLHPDHELKDWQREMPLVDALNALERWGPHRSRRLCLMIPVSEHKALGDLTVRQRRALILELGR